MKKRIFAAIMPFVLIFVMSAQTAQAAEPRAAGATLNLSFNGTTAVCSATCRGDRTSDELGATMTLYQGSTYVDSWTASGTGRIFLSGEHRVTSGKTYRLEVSYTINGVEKPSASMTNTCP